MKRWRGRRRPRVDHQAVAGSGPEGVRFVDAKVVVVPLKLTEAKVVELKVAQPLAGTVVCRGDWRKKETR